MAREDVRGSKSNGGGTALEEEPQNRLVEPSEDPFSRLQSGSLPQLDPALKKINFLLSAGCYYDAWKIIDADPDKDLLIARTADNARNSVLQHLQYEIPSKFEEQFKLREFYRTPEFQTALKSAISEALKDQYIPRVRDYVEKFLGKLDKEGNFIENFEGARNLLRDSDLLDQARRTADSLDQHRIREVTAEKRKIRNMLTIHGADKTVNNLWQGKIDQLTGIFNLERRPA